MLILPELALANQFFGCYTKFNMLTEQWVNGYLAGIFGAGVGILLFLAIWELVWKGFALWHAAKNKQRNWFIAILIINSVGILPILFLKFFQKKAK